MYMDPFDAINPLRSINMFAPSGWLTVLPSP